VNLPDGFGEDIDIFSCDVLSSSAEWNYLVMFAPLAATIVTRIAYDHKYDLPCTNGITPII
jgi:hypothetical protein